MNFLAWLLIGIGIIAGLILIGAFICFYITFFVPKKEEIVKGEYDVPPGKEYEQYRDKIINWQKQTEELEAESFFIKTFDGLTLYGRYYEYQKGAPIELMFHGYRGNAKRDLGGGVQRCFALKRNALLVDQRASCQSGGRVITFGVKESKDCLCWVDFINKHFGKDVKIILTGISMGAATVLMAAQEKLPENVVGVLADCGYTGGKEIIEKVITQIKLPKKILFPIIRLGGILFGGFDINKSSPVNAVKNTTLPIIFFHGDNDNFVPHTMSIENYNSCNSPKRLVLVKGADHGLSFPADEELYLKELDEFGKKYWNI